MQYLEKYSTVQQLAYRAYDLWKFTTRKFVCRYLAVLEICLVLLTPLRQLKVSLLLWNLKLRSKTSRTWAMTVSDELEASTKRQFLQPHLSEEECDVAC